MEEGTIAKTAYDSTEDTKEHIEKVRGNIHKVIGNLMERANVHDESKLGPEEKPSFDAVTPLLSGMVFGSEEYKESTKYIKTALDHHFAVNDHHPQFHKEAGINGMSLMSITEMLCDWKASGERGKDGNIFKSIDINQGRFGISKQLTSILINTAGILWPEEFEKYISMQANSDENNIQGNKEA